MLSELLSAIFPTVQAEEAKEDPPQDEEASDEGGAEDEEEEPEDRHPAIREACQESKQCASATQHFKHCQEKVEAGEGAKGETCVEELCTSGITGSVDPLTLSPIQPNYSPKCAAPKLFAELK
ncbi:hypothetical protein AURDEDRAFT_131072 [Auricularia subglabra TFB-10046 SS5]|uniref:Ubiquinol-cytochrome C reductase hinge domain-containing protein n=1 Tax=Auricularia subglabra (strain TFB-10046 / SS5) TaxID=717982 RepID=J0CVY4_AURST|nr:hypothetical protein AURDEDRAFT_131072 [Auricularia subglabra TFB-10046 SS5]